MSSPFQWETISTNRKYGGSTSRGAEGEEGREGLLGMDSDVLGSSGRAGPRVAFHKMSLPFAFPFISASGIPAVLGAVARHSENKCSVGVRQSGNMGTLQGSQSRVWLFVR